MYIDLGKGESGGLVQIVYMGEIDTERQKLKLLPRAWQHASPHPSKAKHTQTQSKSLQPERDQNALS